jgi:hypothetical protein
MSFVLMTYDVWPVFPAIQLQVPPDIAEAKERFAAFYRQRQPGKKLTWKPALDDVVFRVENCRIKGSAIYFMFLQSVVNKTGFEQAGLSDKAVENLANVLVKCGILVRRRDKGGELALAKKLPAKQLTNLPTPAAISPKAMADKTMEDVAWARRLKIEAALVLTMKRLRIVDVDRLFDETANIVHFHLTRADFDNGLNSCLEKSFMLKNDDGQIVFSTD